ncbi:MAG TPA: M24 family metallopeptidase [Kofleriaceae bacterium]|nr:M24 family metallopeptidase [Kofleriaceae bacterium]
MSSAGAISAEIEEKASRVRALLRERGADGILLRRVSSFAWATGGAASGINTATDLGVGELLVTADARYLVTSAIEAPRFDAEDHLAAQGWQPLVGPWYAANPLLAGRTRGLKLASDHPRAGEIDLAADVSRLRAALTPAEGARFRELGARAAQAIDAAMRRVRPGETEHELAAHLAEEATARGVWPVVDLVATDDRIRRFRHPLPTDKKLERHAMLVLCARKWGLVASVTRFVHFGKLPEDLRRRQQATAEVDATFLAATRPGAAIKDVFARAVARYEATGFGQEWTLHHQGGAAGYEPRESIGTPDSGEKVAEGQAYAWNPSITGTKSEDTILIGSQANEVLTQVAGWPTIQVSVDGASFDRPAVLEVT